MTYDCNLRCRHCYLSAGDYCAKPLDFSFKNLENFYCFFKPQTVSATGGEPVLKKELLFKLAKIINSYGGSLELVTNGFFLTKELADKLHLINPNIFYQISLDGTKKYHNYMRRNHLAYKKAIEAVNIASRTGAKTKVRLTVTDGNLSQLRSVIKKLDSFNRDNIELIIRPVISSGRAKNNNLTFSSDFLKLDKLNKFAKKIKVITTDNSGKCGCGVDTVAIDPAGDIYPCTYLVHNLLYKMGSIKKPEQLKENLEFKNFKQGCYARYLKLEEGI